MDLFTYLLHFHQKKDQGWRINEYLQLIKEYLIELLEEFQQLNFMFVIIFELLIVYNIWIRRKLNNLVKQKQKEKNELMSEALQMFFQSRLDNKNKDNINSLTICDSNNLIDLCQSLKDYNIEQSNADCKNETDRLLLLDLVDKERKLQSKPLCSNTQAEDPTSTTTTTTNTNTNSRKSIDKIKTALTSSLVNAIKNHDIEWSQSRTKFKNGGTTMDESLIINNKYKKKTSKHTSFVENLKKLSKTNVYKCQSDCDSINLLNISQQQIVQSQTQQQQHQTEEDQQELLKVIKSKEFNENFKPKISNYIDVPLLIPMQQIDGLPTISETHEYRTINQQRSGLKMKKESAKACKKHKQYRLPKFILPSDLQRNKN